MTDINSPAFLMGARMAERRRYLKMSLADVGKALGLSHQTIHKYEHGLVRILAEKLQEMADLYGVSISYFFQDFAPPAAPPVPPERMLPLDCDPPFVHLPGAALGREGYAIGCIVEESGEVAQMLGKCLRFGIGSYYNGQSNLQRLQDEAADFIAATDLCIERGVFHRDVIESRRAHKLDKMRGLINL